MDSHTDTAPWYFTGLAFECTACGRCCAGPDEGYVWVTEADIKAIADYLHITPQEMRRKYVRTVGRRQSLVEFKRTHDCVFLTPETQGTRTCRIYPVRPIQCRTWPFWSSNLLHPDTWAEAGARCAGINRGHNLSPEEIDERRRSTRE
ncbi:MAG: YkgJ family cysteine cluster protein [Planctomycetaceae bacterium]|nr:YkgJ family cysteine cluster protein [Planctomycetaceae bacterium]